MNPWNGVNAIIPSGPVEPWAAATSFPAVSAVHDLPNDL
jgi:hypothetical protein